MRSAIRAVRRIFSAHAVALVCAAMISPVEVIWAKEVLGGGNSAYGIVLSAWGAGTLLTGLVLVSAVAAACPSSRASRWAPGRWAWATSS